MKGKGPPLCVSNERITKFHRLIRMAKREEFGVLPVAICILAKNEEQTIGRALAQIAEQTLLHRLRGQVDVHVVANGTSDETVAIAEYARPALSDAGASLYVHDLKRGGKSRAWNTTVHELIRSDVETAIFMDADIDIHSHRILDDLMDVLQADSAIKVCSGYPVKDIEMKASKSLFDAFSLAVSRKSRKPGAINGSLYAARMSVLRDIWLPNETPGEDGFLNAMVTTSGFTHLPDPASVQTMGSPTHSFKAHDVRGFFSHERRMIVGTIVNIWIFEHLWGLRSKRPVGELIRDWNVEDSKWVDHLIRKRADGRNWLIPNEVIFGRLLANQSGFLKGIAYLPTALVATILTLPPALMANKRLKKIGAASTW